MFDALKYVTTPLTLIAFLSIILFYYLRDRNKKQVDLLKEGDAGKRMKLYKYCWIGTR